MGERTVETRLLAMSTSGMSGMERKSHGLTGTSWAGVSCRTFTLRAGLMAVNLGCKDIQIGGLSMSGMTTNRNFSLNPEFLSTTTKR
jgi:hypothetical protein